LFARERNGFVITNNNIRGDTLQFVYTGTPDGTYNPALEVSTNTFRANKQEIKTRRFAGLSLCQLQYAMRNIWPRGDVTAIYYFHYPYCEYYIIFV